MFKRTALRSTLALTLLAFLPSANNVLQAQSVVPPAHTNAVTGGDPQPTGEPPKPKGQSIIDPAILAVLIAIGLS